MGTGYLRGGLCNLVGAIYYFLKQPEDVINSSFKNQDTKWQGCKHMKMELGHHHRRSNTVQTNPDGK